MGVYYIKNEDDGSLTDDDKVALMPLVQATVQIEAGAVKVDGGKHG